MDSNDGGCVQSWMTGWLAGELNAQELLLLTAKILGNSGIFQFAFKVHSESHCKWWYLSINNKQSYATSTTYYVVFTIHFESKDLSWIVGI